MIERFRALMAEARCISGRFELIDFDAPTRDWALRRLI
jgi:hypothetical protein